MTGYLSTLSKRYPLHLQIASLFTLLIMTIGSTIIFFSYHQLTRLTELNTNRQFQHTGEAMAAELNHVTRTMMMSVNILIGLPLTAASTLEERMQSVNKFIEVLKQNNYTSSVYVGYPDGDFFMLRRMTKENRRFFKAAENVSWLVQSNQTREGTPEVHYVFLDGNEQVVGNKIIKGELFDPRTRDWFIQAKTKAGLIATPAYIFKATGEPGFTFSRFADNKKAVIGLDVSLASLSDFLQRQMLPPGSVAQVINSSGQIIASLPMLNNRQNGILATLMDTASTRRVANSSILFHSQHEDWFGSVLNINNDGNNYQIIIAAPAAWLTAGANTLRNESTVIAFILLLLSLPIVWFFSRRISKPLVHLRHDAEAISNLSFNEEQSRHFVVAEVDDLYRAMSKMKRTLKQFISIGSTLAAKDNFPAQMQALLNETLDIAGMDAGMIFSTDKEGKVFTPIAIELHTLNVAASEMVSLAFDNTTSGSFWQLHEGKSVFATFDSVGVPEPLRAFFQPHFPECYIAVPMRTHDQQLLGFVLLLSYQKLSADRGRDKIQLVNALVGNLSVAIEMQYLLREQKNLLNAFIELIAGAIDAKSAYTGGHCQRVPEITKMLARAAVEAKEGPFADFTLSASEWEELHTACWLHDCGKITTPEMVVDKATKLELIYDRIHEVRMRFEVLKREKEIQHLRSQLNGDSVPESEQSLAEELRQLDEDFYFLAQCNIGDEYMSDEALARMTQLAKHQWTRTLDDTAGVSGAEKMRKERSLSQALPVRESILADKEEHIIYRDSKNHMPEHYQFKLKEPAYLYNHGEIYNLSIRRGTLNDEERYKINEHIMQTIIMLNKLPFPRTMANVCVMAGGHHERMDGKGYPYQLSEGQMSIPTKMMAIADVFEALTAADRPYKSAKRLSEALNIMTVMVNDNHLNRELFILFLHSNVWQEYALAYLPEDKVDKVDVSLLLDRLVVPVAAE